MTRLYTLLLFFVLASGRAFAQATPPPPAASGTADPVSGLMFFTLGIVLLAAVGSFLWFLRKKSNRAAADRVLNPKNPANE
jgi:hypothetical protein